MIANVQDLTVTYRAITALDRVTLQMPDGAVGLLGPNGAGKSTLFKTLLAFVTPASGHASVLGFDVARQPLAIRARVGYMPESEAALPDMNAVSATTLVAELGGLDRTAAVSRAHEVLSYVGIGESRYRDVATYSQGMKARVKLAQALVADPDLLLLDEPTNGLDPQGRADMLGLIRDVRKRLGIHFVLSSHLMPDVEEICDHVVLVNQGKVVLSAGIRELKALEERRYRVAIRGDREAFRRALEASRVHVEEDGTDLLVRIPEGRGTDPVLAAATETGSELRKLVLSERSLGEVFVEAVRPGRPGGGGANPAHSPLPGGGR